MKNGKSKIPARIVFLQNNLNKNKCSNQPLKKAGHVEEH